MHATHGYCERVLKKLLNFLEFYLIGNATSFNNFKLENSLIRFAQEFGDTPKNIWSRQGNQMSRSERRRIYSKKDWRGNDGDYRAEKTWFWEDQALICLNAFAGAITPESTELTSSSSLPPFVDFFLVLILL